MTGSSVRSHALRFPFQEVLRLSLDHIGANLSHFGCILGFGPSRPRQIHRQQPGTSEYHIHGVDRLSLELRFFIAVSAIVAHVPDALLLILLEDDRLLRHFSECEEAVQSELTWMHSLSAAFWSRCSAIVGFTSGGKLHLCSPQRSSRCFVH